MLREVGGQLANVTEACKMLTADVGIAGVAGLRRWATPASAKTPLFRSRLTHNAETDGGRVEGAGWVP